MYNPAASMTIYLPTHASCDSNEAILKHVLEDSGTSMLVYNLGYTFIACMTKVMNWATTILLQCIYIFVCM